MCVCTNMHVSVPSKTHFLSIKEPIKLLDSIVDIGSSASAYLSYTKQKQLQTKSKWHSK